MKELTTQTLNYLSTIGLGVIICLLFYICLVKMNDTRTIPEQICEDNYDGNLNSTNCIELSDCTLYASKNYKCVLQNGDIININDILNNLTMRG